MSLFDKKPNIIVLGDIMLDRNINVNSSKIANESSIIAFNINNEKYLLGGCGNVLNNIYNLNCNDLYIFSAIADDESGKIINNLINNLSIKNHLYKIDNYKTTTKIRYFCDNKIIFRADEEKSLNLLDVHINNIVDTIETIIKTNRIDCIVFSDYNKGFLNKELCTRIIKIANSNNIFTCVDPKADYTKYIGCSLIKPNRKEAYDIFKINKNSNLLDIHKQITELVKCKYSVITLAEEGITIFNDSKLIHEKTEIQHIVDVTGAGDIVCSILAYFIPIGFNIEVVTKLATYIATKSVGYPGVYTLHIQDIYEYFHKDNKQIEDITLFKNFIKEKKTVFTNGCFDIIHKGHVELFKFCKSKGDIVIVGLNSDNSIKKLKGESRPVNNLEARISILESIQYIDYIIVFDEDTPYNIIEYIKPDILVKGGDYTLDKIVGKEFAKETIIFNTITGYSTTSIIYKIKN